MPDSMTTLMVITQSVVAGFVAGLCIVQLIWWRSDRGRSGASSLFVWTLTIASVFLVNTALFVLDQGPVYDAVTFLRAQALAACVVLALPAVREFTGGPPTRPYVVAATTGFVLRAVAWLTTDLVVVHAGGTTIARGALAVPSFLVPLGVVVAYTVVALRGTDHRRVRRLVGSTGTLSVALLAVPFLVPIGQWTNALTVIWTVPLASGLTVLGLRRLAAVERDTREEHRARDALAEIGNAAWFATDHREMLARAEEVARAHLGDPSVTATVRPLDRGRFVTTFDLAAGAPPDPRARAFLDDLARIVSIATERIALARDLRQAAFTDSLTGLLNRHALERRLADVLSTATERGTRVAVLLCDVDGFKIENDLHGHAWGDEVLVRTAAHLRVCLSDGDVAARFGGDEFVVLTEALETDEQLVALGRRLRDGLADGDAAHPLPRLSVGVARWCSQAGGAPDQLLRQASTAVLESKRTRSGVVVFDDALRARMQAEEELRRELDTALVDDELTVHYQPVVESRTMRVVGVEALARWQHGGRMRMPGEWMAFAEETGLIVPIGRTVLGVARAGAQRMGLPVMVNVAARELAEPAFLDNLVADWGTSDWRNLTLEITETALLQDLPHVLRSLAALRGFGARIAIDDFGTGYSSFARLADLPVDVLKIDRAFVHRVTTDEGRAVVRAIVSLAGAYRLDVVAEGVETVEQLEVLLELGVPKLQGYLLGRPAAGRPHPVAVPRPSVVPRPARSAGT